MTMNKFLSVTSVAVLVALVGCGQKGKEIDRGTGTQSGFHTQAQTVKNPAAYVSYPNNNGVPSGPVEGTPIVFNGRLYTIIGNSMVGKSTHSFRVDEVGVGLVASVPAQDFLYVSAIVHNGVVYLFGTINRGKIQVRTSTNLLDWTPIADVFTVTNGEEIFNSTITHNGTNFVMALEVRDPAIPGRFFIRFLTSTDLLSWVMTSTVYAVPEFTNCPTLIHHQGYYYMVYSTWKIDSMMTFITRSTDLITWEDASYYPDGWTVPFTPSAGEGNNISDVDFVEHNGSVFFLFARGNQDAWLEMSTATYPGTLSQYLLSFWPATGAI